jgi:type IV pilus assembly protein PilO
MSRTFSMRGLRQRDVALIVIILTLLGVVLWYFYLYRPTQHSISGLHDDIAQLNVQIQRGEAAQRNLPQLRLAVAQLEQDRVTFLSQLPKENQVAQLIEQLRTAAASAGVTLESISKGGGGTQQSPDVRPLAFSLNTQGTYSQTMAFLETLESLKRFTKISQVGFSVKDRGSSNPDLSTSYSFTVYVFTGKDPGARAEASK